MKTVPLLIAAALLAACAAQDEQKAKSTQDAVQAVRDFIAVRDLEGVDKMRTSTSDSWDAIEDRFLIYKGRRGTYLVEFGRRCHELEDSTRVVPDKRWDLRNIRPRFDTIRGCRIHEIYGLTAAEAAELENLGEAPGSRN